MKSLRVLLAAAFTAWIVCAPMLPAIAQTTTTTTTDMVEQPAPDIEGAVLPDATVVITQDPVVTIPYGQWLVALNEVALPFIGAAVVWLLRALPSSIVSIIYTAKVDQLLERAIQFAINRVAGAARDKKLTIPVANKVVREIVQYAISEGPAWLIKWAGGPEGIKSKAIARIQVESNSAIIPSDIKV